MKTTLTLLCIMLLLLENSQHCFAQSAMKKVSLEGMPAFVKELQQGAPPKELILQDPVLYQRLLKRRAVFTGMLQKAVADKQLPKEALQVLNTVREQPQSANTNNNEGFSTAADFPLVKDINTSKDANPYNYNFNYTPTFAVSNNVVYYAADDGIHGAELWRSDGTEEGTYLVKDINPGSASGNAYYITVFKNKLYFMAYTIETGYELYRSDGTNGGTVLLKDIIAGASSSQPQHFAIANNSLYFTATASAFNSQLWKTNGTTAGTVMVADIYTTNNFSNAAQLTAANNILFFTAYSYTYGRELWRSDGTAAGTYMLKDINTSNYYYDNGDGPTNLTSYNARLYFSASDGYTRTLWQSDGSTAGTTVVPYSNSIFLENTSYAVYQDQPFAIAKNSLFFAGSSSTTGTELYKYNPSNTTGIVLVKDISTADVGSRITSEIIRSLNDTIYFILPDFTGTTYNLWKSDGKNGNTKIIKNLPGNVNSYGMNVAGNNLYFSTYSPEYGYEPWISDGSGAGTKLLKDVNPGATGSAPGIFTFCNNKVYFVAASAIAGSELWNTAGNTGSTKLVKNINTTATANGPQSNNNENRFGVALNNNQILFTAYTRTTGYELWKSNGTASGTTIIKDLMPGETSFYPEIYAAKNGKAYFTGSDSTGECIFVTDGTAAGTKKIAIAPNYIYELQVADDGTVFYISALNNIELWRTDSSGTNFKLRTNLGSLEIGIAGNTCYFSAESAYGFELFKSNGTIAGTNLVADIYPGSLSSSPAYFTQLGNKILFSAFNGATTYLCVSDGTTSGTKVLSTTIDPYLWAGAAVYKGKLYFQAYESTLGAELYSTDGTAAGTGLVKNINVSNVNSDLRNFTVAGNTLYFQAYDADNGYALWKTNGTGAGTKVVKTSPNGDGYFFVNNLTSAGGKLYFTYNQLLWVSDGTTAGTTAVSAPGLSNVTSIGYLLGAGNKLFISGYDYTYGYEFYEGDATAGVAAFAATKAISNTINTSGLTAQLVNNPFINDLKIGINAPKNQQVRITVNNYAGQQLVSKTITINAGTNLISLNAGNWIQGLYMINVYSDTGSISLKAVK